MANSIDRLEIVLLVEDDPDHVELILASLQKVGRLINEINCVEDGQKAIEYMTWTGKYNKENAPRPGLILLDIKLPFKDGFEVLKELKSDKRFKTIPIVMLTTTSKSEDITRALDLGANDYIVKPVSWKDFEMKIRSLGKYWAFISDTKSRSRSNSK